MAKPVRHCRNLTTLKKNGSLLFCGTCEKIIGSINPSGYSILKLILCCNCGNNCYLQFSDSVVIHTENVNRIPNFHKGVYSCCKCKKPIFSVITNRVNNYSFYAVCSCGEIYDTRVVHEKRLAETVRLIKNKYQNET